MTHTYTKEKKRKEIINKFITKISSKFRGHLFKNYSQRSEKENGKQKKIIFLLKKRKKKSCDRSFENLCNFPYM